jgi:hypothetical protein
VIILTDWLLASPTNNNNQATSSRHHHHHDEEAKRPSTGKFKKALHICFVGELKRRIAEE